MDRSLGPFRRLRLLRNAPGASLFEALWSDGSPVTLQVARLRPVASPAESVERSHFERTVADRSLGLSAHGRTILAHGSMTEPDGHGLIFWALPHDVGLSRPWRVRSQDELTAAALQLSRELAKSHERGFTEPLLSEASVARDATGAVRIAGVPIAVTSNWSAREAPVWRMAPEEAASERPTPSGDLFRLGQTLSVVAAELGTLSPELAGAIASLAHPDPARRISRATEAVVLFEAITAASDAQPSFSATITASACAPELISELLVETLGDSTRVEATHLPEDAGEPTLMTVTLMPSYEPAIEAAVMAAVKVETLPPAPLGPTLKVVVGRKLVAPAPALSPAPTARPATPAPRVRDAVRIEYPRVSLLRIALAGLVLGLTSGLMIALFQSTLSLTDQDLRRAVATSSSSR